MSIVTAEETLYKQPSERRQYTMDFANLLATGETIEDASPAPIVTSEKINGDSSDLTIETPTVSGSYVQFWISGGTKNTRYRIEVKIETSGTQTLEGDGILVVKDE